MDRCNLRSYGEHIGCTRAIEKYTHLRECRFDDVPLLLEILDSLGGAYFFSIAYLRYRHVVTLAHTHIRGSAYEVVRLLVAGRPFLLVLLVSSLFLVWIRVSRHDIWFTLFFFSTF